MTKSNCRASTGSAVPGRPGQRTALGRTKAAFASSSPGARPVGSRPIVVPRSRGGVYSPGTYVFSPLVHVRRTRAQRGRNAFPADVFPLRRQSPSHTGIPRSPGSAGKGSGRASRTRPRAPEGRRRPVTGTRPRNAPPPPQGRQARSPARRSPIPARLPGPGVLLLRLPSSSPRRPSFPSFRFAPLAPHRRKPVSSSCRACSRRSSCRRTSPPAGMLRDRRIRRRAWTPSATPSPGAACGTPRATSPLWNR